MKQHNRIGSFSSLIFHIEKIIQDLLSISIIVRFSHTPRFLILTILATYSLAFKVDAQRVIYVYDNNNEPIEAASIYVKSNKNIVGEAGSSEVSDINGRGVFKREPLPQDSIFVFKYGFDKFVDCCSNVGDTIYLKENIVELDSLIVTADREQLKAKAGKFIFTPGALKKDVSNSYELIKLAPLLEVKDAAVSIFGVGVSRVQINGEDPHMSDEAIMDMLRGKKPDDIVRVEIVTNPGSSQSASNSGGIVNIIMKDPTQGLIGSFRANLSHTYSRFNPNPSLWLGFAHKKFNMTAYLSYKYRNYFNKSIND